MACRSWTPLYLQTLRPACSQEVPDHPNPRPPPGQPEASAWKPQRGAQPIGALVSCAHKPAKFPPIKHILMGGGTGPCFPVKPERRGWGHFH